MRICLIGPIHGGLGTTGVNTFNEVLAKALSEMAHSVELGIPKQTFNLQAAELSAKMTGLQTFYLDGLIPGRAPQSFIKGIPLEQQLHRYDVIIVSGGGMDFGKILRASQGKRVLIWTHGMLGSPLNQWDGKEMLCPGVSYVCINKEHMQQAHDLGLDSVAVPMSLPIPFHERTVQCAGGFCAAVGNLEYRKNYTRVAEIVQCLGKKTKVYGVPLDSNVKQIFEQNDCLEYCGTVPNETLLDNIAEADFLIHAATTEGRPVAVLEAMGLGVPVIVPDTPLYREFVDPNRNVLIDPNCPAGEQLAKVDLKALCKIKNREALAAETHDKYGIENFKNQLECLLDEELL